ncbi:MAG: hypothetical protein V1729_04005 [Candidatus Woesearchaeota archaeon]
MEAHLSYVLKMGRQALKWCKVPVLEYGERYIYDLRRCCFLFRFDQAFLLDPVVCRPYGPVIPADKDCYLMIR